MKEENEIDAAAETAPEEDGTGPSSSERSDIKAVIDEAVEAVEAVERRREDDGEDDASGELSDDVEELQQEVVASRDRLLRTLADFENFRKRTERERVEDRKYAAVELLREILGIVDNLERALASEGGFDDLKLGVEMILRQMEDFLRRSGVREVEAVDREFDPSVHEAVSRLEDPEVEMPRVIDEMQRGYTFHDRLLRPSIVRVAVPARSEPQDDESEDGLTDEDRAGADQ